MTQLNSKHKDHKANCQSATRENDVGEPVCTKEEEHVVDEEAGRLEQTPEDVSEAVDGIGETPKVALNAENISLWTEADIQFSNGRFPAEVTIIDWQPQTFGVSKHRCLLANEHGQVTLNISERRLSPYPELHDSMRAHREQWWAEREREERDEAVSSVLDDLITKVCELAHDRYMRSAKGKLRRMLNELHRMDPPPKGAKIVPYNTPLFGSRPKIATLHPRNINYVHHTMEALLPYLLNVGNGQHTPGLCSLASDDIEALLEQVNGVMERKQTFAKDAVYESGSCAFRSLMCAHGIEGLQDRLLPKQKALKHWLVHAWALADVNGGHTPVRLVTASLS